MLSVACPTQSPPQAAAAPLPVAAGRGHPEPGPAAGNSSAEPPGTTPPGWGCAWSPPEQRGEEPPRLPTFSAAAQVRVAVTFALFALSAGCNLAVLRAVGGRGSGRRPHIRLLLRHLAAADLLLAVLVMPLDAVWNITLQWRAGDLACRLLMYLRLLAMYASAFVTVVISLDRQAAILRPLAIARARARNRAMLQAAWLLSAGLAVPQVPTGPAGDTPCPALCLVARCRGRCPRVTRGAGMGSPVVGWARGAGNRAAVAVTPRPALPAMGVPQGPVSARVVTGRSPKPGSVPVGLGSLFQPPVPSLAREAQTPITPTPPLSCAAVPVPHHHPAPPAQLHAVHHAGQLPPGLARDPLQHGGLRLPLPAAPAHHGLLLRPHPAGDLPPHGLGAL